MNEAKESCLGVCPSNGPSLGDREGKDGDGGERDGHESGSVITRGCRNRGNFSIAGSHELRSRLRDESGRGERPGGLREVLNSDGDGLKGGGDLRGSDRRESCGRAPSSSATCKGDMSHSEGILAALGETETEYPGARALSGLCASDKANCRLNWEGSSRAPDSGSEFDLDWSHQGSDRLMHPTKGHLGFWGFGLSTSRCEDWMKSNQLQQSNAYQLEDEEEER
eukprot:CAMPEP_0114542950 /NCGR_PEP_ID=MMETSP0114-20121206/2099_1 /TAXON_ID=31324 /ORGANISM="Goniomonas sp, Strain m" /LENGTH=223 /DNA_ID=CAMNT_0001727263 /DNA_START=545 /DNA_END=1217 /DNA_ORIENTATION=-